MIQFGYFLKFLDWKFIKLSLDQAVKNKEVEGRKPTIFKQKERCSPKLKIESRMLKFLLRKSRRIVFKVCGFS